VTTDYGLRTTDCECARAFDFANLERDSCHLPEVMEKPVVEVVEKVEPAPQPVLKVVSHKLKSILQPTVQRWIWALK